MIPFVDNTRKILENADKSMGNTGRSRALFGAGTADNTWEPWREDGQTLAITETILRV